MICDSGAVDDLDWVAERTPQEDRAKWRSLRFGWPSLILLLLALGGAGLGAASLGGWGGFALIVALVIAMLAMLYVWSAVVPDPVSPG